MSLDQWVNDHEESIKSISEIRNKDIHMINSALDIIRKFIIDRGLILYGGQAIDYALKLKGSFIYPDTQIPDLDFLSVRNVDDAYELVDILRKKGFKYVEAVNAIHIQTIKVRIDKIWVADISHTPQKVFDNIPTLIYEGMKIIHPDYQRSDMHLSLCFPYANPPREDIFNRFKKDIKRFNMFQEYYPIVPSGDTLEETKKKSFKIGGTDYAIHGFAAYGFFKREFELLKSGDFGNSRPSTKTENLLPFINLEVAFPSELPDSQCKMQIATPYIDKVLEKNPNTYDHYLPYMEFRPHCAESKDLIVYSTKNQLLSTVWLKYDDESAPGSSSVSYPCIVNVQYLLMDFLFRSFLSETEQLKTLYRNYYANTLKMVIDASKIFEEHPDWYEISIFKLLDGTFGDGNYSQSYFAFMTKVVDQLRAKCKIGDSQIVDLVDNNRIDSIVKPKGYYPPSNPDKVKPHPKFDYFAFDEFQRDGHKIEHVDDISIAEVEGGSIMSVVRRKTYCIEFNQLNRKYFDEILKKAKWESVSVEDALESGHVGILATEGKASWDKRLYDIKSDIKSRLDAADITQKVRLHQHLADADFIPETYKYIASSKTIKSLKNVPGKINFGEMWIWRPEGGFGGRGIAVFNTENQLKKIIKNHKKLFPKEDALISRYITNTATIGMQSTEGDIRQHKFHLRLYFIIAYVPDAPGLRSGVRTALCKYGEIANADKPFDPESTDLDVHNTHIRSTSGVKFPDNYPGGIEAGISILEKSAEVLSKVSEQLMPMVKPFSESRGGYEILGVDMMVEKQSDGSEKPILIEINAKPGYGLLEGDTAKRRNWISKFVLRSVCEIILGDITFKTSNIIPCYEHPLKE